MEQEALEILNMVREGKITAEQGAELLEALKSPPSAPAPVPGRKPQFVRVKVDIKGLRQGKGPMAVNVNLPIALADLALKLAEGAKFQRGDETIVLGDYVKQFSGMDMATILQLVKEGAQGKLVDVNIVGNEGETVKVEVVVD